MNLGCFGNDIAMPGFVYPFFEEVEDFPKINKKQVIEVFEAKKKLFVADDIKNEKSERGTTSHNLDTVKVFISGKRTIGMPIDKYLEGIEKYKNRLVTEIGKQK